MYLVRCVAGTDDCGCVDKGWMGVICVSKEGDNIVVNYQRQGRPRRKESSHRTLSHHH